MPKFLFNIQNIDWEETEEQLHKYVPLNKALSIFDDNAVYVVQRMMEYIHGDYENIVIDYKVRNLHKDQCGCPLQGWHYDCVKDFSHLDRHEHHIIYSNTCGTEFLLEDNSILKANDGDVWEYSRELHRGPLMAQDCKRILIRLTETNTIRR
jgi:hypothetical protein